MTSRRQDAGETLAFLGVALVAVLALYAPSLGIGYFGDDYLYVFRHPEQHRWRYFLEPNPKIIFYRPLLTEAMLALQSAAGMSDTRILHVVACLSHALLATLVFAALRDLGAGRRAAALGGAFVALAQIAGFAVGAPDNLSQVWCTLFGTVATWMAFRASAGSRPGTKAAVGAVALLLACLSKEAGVSFGGLGLLAVAAGARARIGRGEPAVAVAQRATWLALLWITLTIGYFVFRREVVGITSQPTVGGDDNYAFRLGLNVPVNVALLAAATLLQGSTETVFVALKDANATPLLLAAAATAAFVGMLAVGLRRTARPSLTGWLCLLALGAMLPAVLINHVSELYAYNVLPFAGGVVGLGGAAAWNGAGRVGRRLLLLLSVVLATVNVIAVRSKLAGLRDSADRAAAYLDQILPMIPDFPPNGTVVLVNTVPPRPTYSEFRLRGFDVFDVGGLTIFPELSGRDDLTWRLVEPSDTAFGGPGAIRLGLDGDRVVQLR